MQALELPNICCVTRMRINIKWLGNYKLNPKIQWIQTTNGAIVSQRQWMSLIDHRQGTVLNANAPKRIWNLKSWSWKWTTQLSLILTTTYLFVWVCIRKIRARKSQAKQCKRHRSHKECDSKHASDLLQKQEEDTVTIIQIREERRRRTHTPNEQKRERWRICRGDKKTQQKKKRTVSEWHWNWHRYRHSH